MENQLGLLRFRIIRGINLAIRDLRSSDPCVVVSMGKQKLKTRMVNKNVNPQWDEDVTLCVAKPILPIKLQVYDKDIFSRDDKMDDAELDIVPFIDAARTTCFKNILPNGAIISTMKLLQNVAKLLPIVPSANDEICYDHCSVSNLAKNRLGGFGYVPRSNKSDDGLITPFARNFITILNDIKYKSW